MDEIPVATGDGDPETHTKREDELASVDAGRGEDRGDDRRPLLVRGEELEAHRLYSLATGPAQRGVASECDLEPLLEKQPERDVEAATRVTAGVNGVDPVSSETRIRSQSK